MKRKTAIAVRNAGALRIQKDHLHKPKKVKITGDRVKPTTPPTLEPVT